MIYFVGNKPLIEDGLFQIATVDDCLEYFKDKKVIGSDTETEGFDPLKKKLLTLQLGDFDNQFVIDWNFISNEDKLKIKKFLENSEKEFIFHNANFDLKFLFHQKIFVANVFDTYLAEAVLYQGFSSFDYPKSLKHCVEKYANYDLDKSVRGHIHFKGLSTDVIVYSALDVKYLHIVREKQLELLKEKELLNTIKLENQFVRVLVYITLSGIKLDVDKWKQRIDKDKILLVELEDKLNQFILQDASGKYSKYIDNQLDLFNDSLKTKINWNSSKQVISFFKDLGLNLQVKDKETGKIKDSVDAKVLLPQVSKDPIIQIYLNYKGQEKVLSTYGENWLKQLNYDTGRLYSQYHQLLDTARISSGGKDKSNNLEYINFLNVPQDNEIRNCVIPEDNYSFIDCDYSSQENIVFVNKCLDKNLLEFYEKNLCEGDMHTFVTKKINPELETVSTEDVKKLHKDKRHMAKIAGFSILYGGVGATIANNLSIPIEEGERVYSSYMNAFPDLSNYFNKCKKETLAKGYIVTDDVVKRKIFCNRYDRYKELDSQINSEFWNEYKEEKSKDSSKFKELKEIVREYFRLKGEIERKALNFPIQSTSASMSKIACIYVFREIEKQNKQFKVLFPLFIHDQIILEVPDEEIDQWKEIVQNSMEKAGDLFCKTVKIKADPVVTKCWTK